MTALSVAYALDVGRKPVGTLAVGCAVLAGQLSIGWQNDALDAPGDRLVGRRDKPVARGAIPRRRVAMAALAALAATVPLSLWSGWMAGGVHLVAVGCATAYNVGLKATAWSMVPYLVAFSALPAFVTMGAPGTPLPPWWIPLATGLLGCAAHLLNVLPDRVSDLAMGIRGLPQRMSERQVIVASAIALVTSASVLAFGPGSPTPDRAAAFLVLAGLGAGACAAAVASPTSRLPFGIVIVVAGADVGYLLLMVHH